MNYSDFIYDFNPVSYTHLDVYKRQVSKMLTHKNVTTTQIYADLVNSKKRETANKISLK